MTSSAPHDPTSGAAPRAADPLPLQPADTYRPVCTSGELATTVADMIHELQAGDPLGEVLVVTPPGSIATMMREMLPRTGEGRGVAGAHFVTPIRLAEEILQRASSGSRSPGGVRRAGHEIVAATIRAVLARRCPPALESVREQPAIVNALEHLVRRTRHVPAAGAAVDELAGHSHTRRALVETAIAVRERLRALGFDDDATILERARAQLSSSVAHDRAPIEVVGVVIVLAEPFHPAHVPLLRQLTAWRPYRVVVLHPARDDHDVRGQAESLCPRAPADARDGDVGGDDACGPDVPPDLVVSAPDHDVECRHAVRRVAQLATGAAAVPLERITLLFPSTGPHHRCLTAELDRAAIPWSGPLAATLQESLAGQVLRLLVDAIDDPDRVRVLRLAGVASRRTSSDDLQRWRELAARLGLVNAADWAVARPRLDRAHEDAVRAGRRPVEQLTFRHERDARDLDALLAFVARLRTTADVVEHASTWRAAADAVGGALDFCIGTAKKRESTWRDLPSWQMDAAQAVSDAVTALAELDDGRLSAPYSWHVMRASLHDALTGPLGSRFADTPGVRVRPIHDGVGTDADVVLVVGANDGTLPRQISDDLIAPADHNAAGAGWLEHAGWQRARETRAWRAVLRSSATVEVSFSRSDIRGGGSLYPSPLLTRNGTAIPGITVIQSHATEVREATSITLGEMLVSAEETAPDDPILRARARAGLQRRLHAAGPYDGLIGPQPELDPTARQQSITSLESLASCGLGYFLERVLRVSSDDDPSDTGKIPPLHRGNLVHGVLEAIVLEWLEHWRTTTEFLDGEHWPVAVATLERSLDEQAELLRAAGHLGHPARWAIERSMIIGVLTDLLAHDRGHGVEPFAAEYSFGDLGTTAPGDADRGQSSPPLIVETPLGPVSFRGKIDRIDRVGARVVVTDFKTTQASRVPAPPKGDPTDGGTRLQLPLYARVAARDVPTPAHVERHRDDDSGGAAAVQTQYVFIRPWDTQSKEIENEQDEAQRWIEVLAGRIQRGDFTPGPPNPRYGCRHCAPDGFGISDLERRRALIAASVEAATAEAATLEEVDE